jgi:hypothetical protein
MYDAKRFHNKNYLHDETKYERREEPLVRLCHKSIVIASDRRECGDLNCVTVSAVMDCHVVRPACGWDSSQ